MEKTENCGFLIVPHQEHITFPLLNVIMDIVNSNFLLLDTLMTGLTTGETPGDPILSDQYKKWLEQLTIDMNALQSQMNEIKEKTETTELTVEDHTNILEELQKEVDAIPDIYARKDYTYDTITIDRIAKSVHHVKHTMAKLIHDMQDILLTLGDQEKEKETYTREEIDEKLKLIDDKLSILTDIKEYLIITESNHKDLFDGMVYLTKKIENGERKDEGEYL